jgi:DNA-binding transcriptional regulator GbsR (MarR family)
MTVKDICMVSGLSKSTVKSKIKALFPERCVQGKRTTLTQEQSLKVLGDLRNRGFVTPYDVKSHFEQPQQVDFFEPQQFMNYAPQYRENPAVEILPRQNVEVEILPRQNVEVEILPRQNVEVETQRTDSMTITDICTLTGLSDRTIQRKIKELFPECCVNGKRTFLTKEQSFKVVEDLRKKGFITPVSEVSEKRTVDSEDWKVSLQAILQHQEEISQRQQEMFQQGIAQIVQAITTTQKALPQPTVEIVQDYYSLLGYCRLIGKVITFSEAVAFGKLAKKESKGQGYPVRRVPDERYGYVGSYSIDILNQIFET